MRAPFVNDHRNTEVDEGTGNQRQPGAWPVTPSFTTVSAMADPPVFERGNEAWLKLQAERAERHIILGRIRANLEAEPNGRAIRASARRWSSYITNLGETVATERETEGS